MSEQNGPSYSSPAGSVPRSTTEPAVPEAENQELQSNVTPDTEETPPVLSPTSVEVGGGGSSRRPPGFGGGGDDGNGGGGGEEEEMAKMSFLDHLVELRQRLIRCLIAV